MKIEITVPEGKMLTTALSTKIAQLERSRNTEQNIEVRDIRDKEIATYTTLANKVMTGELK